MPAHEEWIDFYHTHFRRVVRFVMHNGASQDQACDAAQDAFVESWELMVKDPSRWQAIERKDAWIRTVALRRYWRPPGPRKRVPMWYGGEITERVVPGPCHDELTVQGQMVLQELQTLDPEARAVTAFDLDGFSTVDIAAALEVKPQRVRDIRKRARAALKRQLARNAEGRHP